MKAVDPTVLAITLMRLCANGFRDEWHHKGWRKKWAQDIASLPPPLKAAVLFSWEQATMSEEVGQ